MIKDGILKNQKGQGMIEYAAIIGLIGIAGMAGMQMLGERVTSVVERTEKVAFSDIKNVNNNATTSAGHSVSTGVTAIPNTTGGEKYGDKSELGKS